MQNSKKQKCYGTGEDRISDLPDSILVHILSFLPTREAVQTVLIRRFQRLWTAVDTLSFHQCMFPKHDCVYYRFSDPSELKAKSSCAISDLSRFVEHQDYDERFLNFIRHALILHERTSILKFHLHFHFNFTHSSRNVSPNKLDKKKRECLAKEKRMANEIDTWIRFALRKNVKVLDLTLDGHGTMKPHAYYVFPYAVYNSAHLVELRLNFCSIRTREKGQLSLLKVLYLDNVLLTDKSADDIVSGCPLLEELVLWGCCGLSNVNLANPNLKKLIICIGKKKKLHISCPTLVTLWIGGYIERLEFTSLLSLTHATIGCFFSLDLEILKENHEIRMLFQQLSQTKTIELRSECTLLLTAWKLANLQCPTFNFKSVVLCVHFTKWQLPGILSLLMNSPSLESLTIHFSPGYTSELQKQEKWFGSYVLKEEEYLKSQDATFHCLAHNLKTVDIFGDPLDLYVVEVAEFLLKNAMVLDKMVLSEKKPGYSHKPHIRTLEFHEVSQRLLSIQRASAKAVLHICYD